LQKGELLASFVEIRWGNLIRPVTEEIRGDHSRKQYANTIREEMYYEKDHRSVLGGVHISDIIRKRVRKYFQYGD
jgi:hypothetical protein